MDWTLRFWVVCVALAVWAVPDALSAEQTEPERAPRAETDPTAAVDEDQRALEDARRALEALIDEKGEDHLEVAAARKSLATRLFNLNDLLGAEEELRLASDLLLSSAEADPALAGESLNNLAYVLAAQDRREDAIAVYLRAIEHYRSVGLKSERNLGVAHKNLANTFTKVERDDEAERHFRIALEIFEIEPDENALLIDEAAGWLAQHYAQRQDTAPAEAAYGKVIAARKAHYGPAHHMVVAKITELARLLGEQGRFEEAEDLHREGLALYQESLGVDHYVVGWKHLDLGRLFHAQDRIEEADREFKKAEPFQAPYVAAEEAGLGADSPAFARVLLEVGSNYRFYIRDLDVAQGYFERALAILERTQGTEDTALLEVVTHLGKTHEGMKRFADAQPYYRRALQLTERLVGADDPRLIPVLKDHAYASNETGRHEEADLLLERAVRITEVQSGPDSLELAERYSELSVLASRRGDYRLSETRSLEALEIFRRVGGPSHPRIRSQLRSLMASASQGGQLERAAGYAVQILRFGEEGAPIGNAQLQAMKELAARSRLLEPRPDSAEHLYEALVSHMAHAWDTVEHARSFLLYEFGRLYQQQSRGAAATTAFQRSIEVYRSTGGNDPDWIAPQHVEMAKTARQEGRFDEALALAEEALALLTEGQSENAGLLVNTETLLGRTLLDLGDQERSKRFYTRALDRSRRIDPPEPRRVAAVLYDLAGAQEQAGEPRVALTTLDRALSEVERAYGADDPDYESYLGYRGFLLSELGDLEGSEKTLRRAVGLAERNGRMESERASANLADLGLVLKNLGRLEESVELLDRSLRLQVQVLGPDDLRVADVHIVIGDALTPMGRFDRAAAHYERALEIREANADTEDRLVVWAMARLAKVRFDTGDIDEAEALYRRALDTWAASGRPDSEGLGWILRDYSEMLQAFARYGEGESLARRALASEEEAFGKTSPELINSLSRLTHLYTEMGRSFDASEHQLRAVAILEAQADARPLALANALIQLAFINIAWKEEAEAVEILARSQRLLDQVEDRRQLDFAQALMKQGDGLLRTEQFEQAESVFRDAGRIFEAVSGGESFNLTFIKLNLANSRIQQKDFEQGLALIEEAFQEIEARFGPDSPVTSMILDLAPAVYLFVGRPDAAMAMFDEALDGRRGSLLQGHPLEVWSLVFRALVALERGQLVAALDLVSKASASERRNIQRAAEDRTGAGGRGAYNFGLALALHIAVLDRMAKDQPERRERHLASAFELAQEGRSGSAAGALARMAARFSAGSDRLGQVVRERQDSLEMWAKISRQLSSAAAQPLDRRDQERESGMREDLGALDERIRELDQLLAQDFPDYATLVRPGAVSLSEVQALLRPDEGLLFLNVGSPADSPALEQYLQTFLPGRTTLWVVRRDSIELEWVDLDSQAVEEDVARIRRTLDPTGLFIERLEDIPPFDGEVAYALYRKLIAPVEEHLRGLRNVFIVPSGPLQSLPLGVLVTEPLTEPIVDLSDYRDVPWLARRYAMTTLPSVASLRSLRHFAGSDLPLEPFTGFGNPVLKGSPGQGRGINLATYFRGAVANVSAVRALPALPESEEELKAMAAALDASTEQLFLGEAATETRIKSLDLSNSRILAFATHGLVAGELNGNVEPALVLTPPEAGSARDDGLLTASEIAQLKLNADWVILSACNTGAGAKPGAEGLSGLARAFFYAGSRSLLVSHWPVASDAAVKLTTTMLVKAKEPDVTRAEALQHSILTLMEDADRPHYAHPMFWAPFTVVGEGGLLD